MTVRPQPLIDVNASIGPWPHGDAPELDAASLVARMDRLGIERALVHHSTAWLYDAATGNRRLLEEIEHEPRLLPCFVLGPLETGEFGDPADLPGALAAAGVRAVRIYPRDHGWTLAGESGLLFRTLAEAGVAVVVDLAQTDWQSVSALATREPGLRMVICSVGYRELRVLLPLLDRHPNLACDLSYFSAHQGVEVIVRRFGADRLLFGTGMPVAEPAGAVACLAWADLDDASRAAIGAGNAQRLLDLEPLEPGPPEPLGVTIAEAALETMLAGQPLHELDVFDVHGHLGAWFAFWLPEQGLESILAQMDRCGVGAVSVSSLLAIGPDAPNGNEEAVEAARSSGGRIFAYVVANPHRPDLSATLEAQLQLPEVVGLKIHPDTHTCPADDSAYDWVWRLAQTTGSVVLSHTFAGTPWSDPLRFDRVAERFPDVRIILAHAGVTPDGFRRSIDICTRHPQLVVDTSGSYMTGHWIRHLVEELGPHRVLYGSDTPFIDLRYGLGRVVGAGFDDDTLRLVIGGNARALLGTRAASVHTTLQGG